MSQLDIKVKMNRPKSNNRDKSTHDEGQTELVLLEV